MDIPASSVMDNTQSILLSEDHQILALMDAMRNNPPNLLTQSSHPQASISADMASGSSFTTPNKSVNIPTVANMAPLHRGSIDYDPPDSCPHPTSTQGVIAHPFSSSSAKLVLIPSNSTADGIDVEEEARLYDELSRSYEDGTDDFSRSNTPTRSTSYSKLVKPNPSAHHRGERRPRSRSLPPESILSADIYLADNTGQTPLGVPPIFAQDVQITGWSIVGDGGGKFGFSSSGRKSVSGGGAYVVYDCVITTKEGTTMHILKRYSAFEQLREDLKRTLPHPLLPLLPSLPPKSALGRFRPAFLDSRRKLLQHFLAAALLHPEIGGREVVRKWVLN